MMFAFVSYHPGSLAMAEAAQNMAAEDAEWLRQLEAPRGRDGALMCVARWHTNEQLALVEREKGSDMHVFGVYKQGQLWLSAEETLCLVEDGLLELMLGGAPPLSVQRATHELLGRGGASAARKYAVFTHLHRHGFVCRPTALEPGCQFPLFEVRHRRGYSRRAVEAGSQPPLFIAAIFDATAQMPPVRELQARPPLHCGSLATRTFPPLRPRPLRRTVCPDGVRAWFFCWQALALHCAPVPVRCACAHEQEVLFFEIGSGEPPPPPTPAAPASAADGAAGDSTGGHGSALAHDSAVNVQDV